MKGENAILEFLDYEELVIDQQISQRFENTSGFEIAPVLRTTFLMPLTFKQKIPFMSVLV